MGSAHRTSHHVSPAVLEWLHFVEFLDRTLTFLFLQSAQPFLDFVWAFREKVIVSGKRMLICQKGCGEVKMEIHLDPSPQI